MDKRHIQPKMFEYIDSRLKDNGFAQDAILRKDARTLMVEAAKTCVGIREKTGNNDGEMVELIQCTVGGHYNEAWCMAQVMTIIAYVEKKLGLVSRLMATECCADLWDSISDDQRVQFFPKAGAIAIWKHASGGGHTGIFVEGDGKEMVCIEGNTTSGFSSDEKVVREGGGTYRTKRSMVPQGEMKLVGFIKPF